MRIGRVRDRRRLLFNARLVGFFPTTRCQRKGMSSFARLIRLCGVHSIRCGQKSRCPCGGELSKVAPLIFSIFCYIAVSRAISSTDKVSRSCAKSLVFAKIVPINVAVLTRSSSDCEGFVSSVD